MPAATIKLEIHRPDKDPSTFDIDAGVYTVGSDGDCKIALPHSSVSDRHAILSVHEDSIWIEDLASEAGTLLDGVTVDDRAQVHNGQTITIGPFSLVVNPSLAPAIVPEITIAAEPEQAITPPAPPPAATTDAEPEVNTSAAKSILDQKRSIKQQIHKELVDRMDIKRMSLSGINQDELMDKAKLTIEGIVNDVRDRLPQGISPEDLTQEIFNEALALGPLEIFLADEDVTEIMVNGPDRIYVEKKGKLTLTDQSFLDNASVLAIIERIVAPLGRRIDESQPYVDARLADGSRVNAIINPLSLVGPCLTIRKFSKVPFTDQDLINLVSSSLKCSLARGESSRLSE